jgi:putative ABC transport system permease protein
MTNTPTISRTLPVPVFAATKAACSRWVVRGLASLATAVLCLPTVCLLTVCPPAAAAGPREMPPKPLVLVETVVPPNRSAGQSRFGLTIDDYHALVQTLPTLVRAVPTRTLQQDLRVGERLQTGQLIGTTPEYADLHRCTVETGRFLTQTDLDRLRNVAVLGSGVTQRLFPSGDAVGQCVRIGRHYVVVIGTLTADDPTSRLNVYLPLSTMRSRLGDRVVTRTAGAFELQEFELSGIELELAAWTEVSPAAVIVRKLLEARHQDQSYRVIDTLKTLRALEADRPRTGSTP